MPNIRIITDSASDIIPPLEPNLTVLPMTVRFGDTEYKDGIDITHSEFYEKLIESDELPATSLISPAVFADAYEQAALTQEELIVITVSSKLSGTYQSAVLASEDYPKHVHVFDSRSAAIGEQILVRFALQLIDQGLSVPEILRELEQARERVHVVALLDTLEYLKKGGRVPSSVAFVGGVLSIKPVLCIRDGEVHMLGTARGSRNGSNFLIKEIEKTEGIDFSMPLCLGYSGLDDHLLQKYIKDSEAIWHGHEECLNITTLGATIGTHAGPNAIAIAFFSR